MERTARRPRPLFLAPIALPVALFVRPKPDFGRTWPDVAEMGPLLRRFAPKSACSEIAKNREQTAKFFFKISEFSRIRISPKKWEEPRELTNLKFKIWKLNSYWILMQLWAGSCSAFLGLLLAPSPPTSDFLSRTHPRTHETSKFKIWNLELNSY